MEHTFFHCKDISKFWKDVAVTIENRTKIKIDLTETLALFGVTKTDVLANKAAAFYDGYFKRIVGLIGFLVGVACLMSITCLYVLFWPHRICPEVKVTCGDRQLSWI